MTVTAPLLIAGDGEATFIRAIGQQAEDAVDADKARPLGQRAAVKAAALLGQRTDGGDPVIGDGRDRMGRLAKGGLVAGLVLAKSAGSGMAKTPPCTPGRASVAAGMSQRVRPIYCTTAGLTPFSDSSWLTSGRAPAVSAVRNTACAPEDLACAAMRGMACTIPFCENS